MDNNPLGNGLLGVDGSDGAVSGRPDLLRTSRPARHHLSPTVEESPS
jgi:hypothetical protein